MAVNEQIRWGLAGYGNLSRKRLVEALNGQGYRLDVVWGRQLLKAQEFAQKYQIPRATDDLKTLMQYVDAIYVATPVNSHVPIMEMALSHNLQVIVEKPLSPLIDSTNHLVEIAIQKQIRVAVAYYRRWMPAARYVKDLLASGTLGRLHQVTVEFHSLFAPSADDPQRWRCDPAMAGAGVIADAGSHRLDLLCWFFGLPKMLKAALLEPFPEGCERVAKLELLWPDDLSAACHFSWQANQIQDFIKFDFEHGQLLWNPLDTGYLRFVGKQETWEQHLPPATNPHAAFIFAFCEDLPCCSIKEAVLVDLIIEAAVKSNQNGGAWINLHNHNINFQLLTK